MTQPPYYQPSHSDRNVIIAIVLIVVVVVVAVGVAASVFFFTAISRSPLSQVHTQNIVNGLITVQAGQYNYYQFTVPTSATSIHLIGGFTASGGSGNDIVVYVMDRTNFVNWSNNHAFTSLYNSGQLTTGSFSVALLAGSTYDLVYSNTFSSVASKNVQTGVSLLYTL